MVQPLQAPSTTPIYNDDMDSTHSSACSTPYVSAPSSPGHAPPPGYYYYYSAPASPMHYLISSQQQLPFSSQNPPSSFDDFGFENPTTTLSNPMSSADELFCNGQIRPMRLAPLLDGDETEEGLTDQALVRGRDMKLRSKSLRRRTRSMSPMRSNGGFDWKEENGGGGVENQETEDQENDDEGGKIEEEGVEKVEITQCDSGSSSRSNSVGRSSKRWVLLKEFLYRSKSEGRNNGQKFWGNLSFSPVVKDKKGEKLKMKSCSSKDNSGASEQVKKKRTNGVMGKRRMTMPSAHEMHYKTNRAQAEEMRKKTFLPYRQGLLGCLGFSSRSYGAWNGFTRALNPVSSR